LFRRESKGHRGKRPYSLATLPLPSRQRKAQGENNEKNTEGIVKSVKKITKKRRNNK